MVPKNILSKYLEERPKLLGLILGVNKIEPGCQEALLSGLELNKFEPEELSLAFKTLRKEIHILNLSGNNLGEKSVDWLKQVFKAIPRHITSINLSNNHLDKLSADELKEALSTASHLQEIKLNHNNLVGLGLPQSLKQPGLSIFSCKLSIKTEANFLPAKALTI